MKRSLVPGTQTPRGNDSFAGVHNDELYSYTRLYAVKGERSKLRYLLCPITWCAVVDTLFSCRQTNTKIDAAFVSPV